jgi:hypothetical protein
LILRFLKILIASRYEVHQVLSLIFFLICSILPTYKESIGKQFSSCTHLVSEPEFANWSANARTHNVNYLQYSQYLLRKYIKFSFGKWEGSSQTHGKEFWKDSRAHIDGERVRSLYFLRIPFMVKIFHMSLVSTLFCLALVLLFSHSSLTSIYEKNLRICTRENLDLAWERTSLWEPLGSFQWKSRSEQRKQIHRDC